MATTTANLRYVKDGDPRPQSDKPPRPPAGALPLGTCGMCEATLFAAFEEVSGGDETISRSPDRRAAEAAGEQVTARWQQCRHCGRAFDTGRLEAERIGDR